MVTPIMPQGTAVWLIDNTSLTFAQIAKACGLHELEVQALADDQSSVGMMGVNPIEMGQLTQEEIDRCSKDENAELHFSAPRFQEIKKKSKRKYTPFIKRQDRPDAIAWLLKFYPEMSDATIASLLATTKSTVVAIRNRTRARINELRPRDPVLLGFCSQVDMDKAVRKLRESGAIAPENSPN